MQFKPRYIFQDLVTTSRTSRGRVCEVYGEPVIIIRARLVLSEAIELENDGVVLYIKVQDRQTDTYRLMSYAEYYSTADYRTIRYTATDTVMAAFDLVTNYGNPVDTVNIPKSHIKLFEHDVRTGIVTNELENFGDELTYNLIKLNQNNAKPTWKEYHRAYKRIIKFAGGY